MFIPTCFNLFLVRRILKLHFQEKIKIPISESNLAFKYDLKFCFRMRTESLFPYAAVLTIKSQWGANFHVNLSSTLVIRGRNWFNFSNNVVWHNISKICKFSLFRGSNEITNFCLFINKNLYITINFKDKGRFI